MKLTQALHDTVHLMEGGHVARTRRPGECFDEPEYVLLDKSKPATVRTANLHMLVATQLVSTLTLALLSWGWRR